LSVFNIKGHDHRLVSNESGTKAVKEHLLARPIGIEKPAFGVEKALIMKAHLDRTTLQERNQILDHPQRLSSNGSASRSRVNNPFIAFESGRSPSCSPLAGSTPS
jgi:hypothetical protein